MTRTRVVAWCAVQWACLGAVGCGAAAPQAVPPATPAVVPAEAPAADKSVESVAPPSVVAAPPPPPPPTAAGGAAGTPLREEVSTSRGGGAAISDARGELRRAEGQLQASAGDCATACRALASMERATTHLCALATSGDDARACQDAKSAVLAGRDKVRASCGECPGGPSLDKNAPIPSVR